MLIREGHRMNDIVARSAGFGAASLLAGLLLAGSALADGLPTRGKTTKAPEVSDHPCMVSGNVGVTSDYVFRGISQSNENQALQSTVDLTCGRFYLGVFGTSAFTDSDGSTEFDIYGGVRAKTGPVNWDFGFIYYTYPGAPTYLNLDYVEVKAAASGEIWKGGTLTGTVFYSPEYTRDSGTVWTVEGTFSQVLPSVGIFTPTFSATVGNLHFADSSYLPDYVYWNAGLTLGFREKWSIDLRYWDTDLSDGRCDDLTDSRRVCDSRFVATLKYSF
jgi:uncharacterized protein (TIGR02001 family)